MIHAFTNTRGMYMNGLHLYAQLAASSASLAASAAAAVPVA